jgi:hypothetical protein
MARDEKRKQRREKRAIKRQGNRRARRALARSLRDNPEEAEFDEVDFGDARSAPLNGTPRVRPETIYEPRQTD